jgi:hypothetical protein
MATCVIFNDFREQLGLAAHNLNTDTLKVYLTNATPSAANDTALGTPADISAATGYAAGGIDTQNTWAQSTATAVLTGTSFTITAGAAIGPFSYAVLYNDTSGGNLLICYWAIPAAPITMASGDTFVVKFNDAASGSPGTILTLQ